MNTSIHGTKHLCPECAAKYYDLNNAAAVCPKCGAKPPEPKERRPLRAGRASGGSTFWRYPAKESGPTGT